MIDNFPNFTNNFETTQKWLIGNFERNKKGSQKIWIQIELDIKGTEDFRLVYILNYEASEQHLKKLPIGKNYCFKINKP